MDAASIADRSLVECLRLIERVFDPRAIIDRQFDDASLAEYYRQSGRGYRLFHSADGALHLSLDFDGQLHKDGLYTQANIVQRHVDELDAARILEAGSGNGFNLVYLARRNPERQFVGVDKNVTHLQASRRAAKDLPNLKFEAGDYEHLDYADATFDIAFAVESLCQTNNLESALADLHRVLRPGGRFICVDCFRATPITHFGRELQLAVQLVEKATAVNAFPNLTQTIEVATARGFRQLEVNTLTSAVLPNLQRLYGLARRFFNMSSGVRIMKYAFPPMMLENAICGLLAPHTFGAGVHGYYSLVLERGE
jgi:sterol 24-C-methyltransferase